MDRRIRFFYAAVCAGLLLVSLAATAGTGVLVVAKDRGTVGNQELEAAVHDLDPDYPVELLLVGPDRQGMERGYAGYIEAARERPRKRRSHARGRS